MRTDLNLAGKSREEIQAVIDQQYWHHSFDFGGGLIAKGRGSIDYIATQEAALLNGVRLTSASFLDIGAWTGAFSFAAKRRGAERVVASDKYCWTNSGFRGRDAFEIARELIGLEVEAKEIDVPEISPDSVGYFDVVLFSGVFYHLLDPIHLTGQIAECASDVLIIETHQDLLNSDRPGMIYYPGDILNGDPSNYWGPNPQAVYHLLKEFGFERVFYQDPPGHGDPNSPIFRTRGIYHAFRTQKSLDTFGEITPEWTDLDHPVERMAIFEPVGVVPPAPAPAGGLHSIDATAITSAISELSDKVTDIAAIAARADDEAARLRIDVRTANEQIAEKDAVIANLIDAQSGASIRELDLTSRNSEMFALQTENTARIAALQHENSALRRSIEAIHKSSSWRITAPIRTIVSVFKRRNT